MNEERIIEALGEIQRTIERNSIGTNQWRDPGLLEEGIMRINDRQDRQAEALERIAYALEHIWYRIDPLDSRIHRMDRE